MLVYHPVYDVNHCIYRFLLITELSVHTEFDWEQIRLMDFYLVFPHLLKAIKPFPLPLKDYKSAVNAIPDAYEHNPNPKRVLFDLNTLQNTAAMNLMAKHLIDVEMHEKNIIRRTSTELPKKLVDAIHADEIQTQPWFKVIVDEIPMLEFKGKNGLKKRSGLLEFRYDPEVKK